MNPFDKVQSHRAGGGFSLVEVVLALGLCTFVLVALLALFPVSLQTARQATEINRMSKIMQKVASELSQDKFENVKNLPLTTRGFDYDGNEVAPTSPDRHFTVTVRVDDSPVANQAATNLLRVRINCATPTEAKAGSLVTTVCDMGY